jgi:hypothetical protein
MKKEEIRKFFSNLNSLNLKKKEKERLLRLFQVRGSNQKNVAMTFNEFKAYIAKNNGKITNLVLGPEWNRIVFVDIDIEV